MGWLELFSLILKAKDKKSSQLFRRYNWSTKAEKKLKQTNRFLKLLSKINEVIARANNEKRL